MPDEYAQQLRENAQRHLNAKQRLLDARDLIVGEYGDWDGDVREHFDALIRAFEHRAFFDTYMADQVERDDFPKSFVRR